LRYGNEHPSIVPFQPFEASDGWIAVAAANDGLFARLCCAIGRPELATDARFATNAGRVKGRRELVPQLVHECPVGRLVGLPGL
jgi:succinate--hydroxymethylglutarate CoA-transferase